MAETVVDVGDSLFDVAVREYGHIQGIYDLVKANGVGFSDSLPVGTVLQAEETGKYAETSTADATVIGKQTTPLVKVEPGQNIFDIAIALGGSVEYVLGLVKDNGLSFSSVVPAGVELKVIGDPKNKTVAQYFSNRRIATGADIRIDGKAVLEGVDYWAIEKDFIVQ